MEFYFLKLLRKLSINFYVKSVSPFVRFRYKESITKSTRGWKERLFSRNSSVADLGSEVRREVNAGIASVSRMMERLETRGSNGRTSDGPAISTSEVIPSTESSNERVTENNPTTAATSTSNTSASSAPCVTTTGSN